MEIEQLPERLRIFVSNLRHPSSTIRNDINDALEDANNTDEFINLAIDKLNGVMSECKSLKKSLILY